MWLNNDDIRWHDDRPEAVRRCAVNLPVDAPLPDDLEWTVVERFRDRDRWVDVVIIEGPRLPLHVAGEFMTKWMSFDQLRNSIARALAAAFLPKVQQQEFWSASIGTPTTMSGTTTSWSNLGSLGFSTTK